MRSIPHFEGDGKKGKASRHSNPDTTDRIWIPARELHSRPGMTLEVKWEMIEIELR